MIRRPPRSTQSRSSAASDVYKRQVTICIHDDGGMANASVDTSIPQTFTITVNPHNDQPVDTYTLTYTAGANGTISGTSPQTVNQGASGIAVTATPNGGYHFVS